jgi:hypothetical protein
MPRIKRESREKIPDSEPLGSDSPEVKRRYGLCFRCQHRVDFLESQIRSRYECGVPTEAVCACYQFLPILPVAVEPADAKDPRPVFGPPMIAGRVRIVGPVPSGEYYMVARRVSNGLTVVPDILAHKPMKTKGKARK